MIRRRPLLLWLLCFVPVTGATVLPLCGLMFRCGCTLRSGEKYCNVHERFTPHCPWCEGGAKAFLPGYALATASAGAVAAAILRRRGSPWRALLISLLVYFPLMALGGLIAAKAMHYPMWFGMRV